VGRHAPTDVGDGTADDGRRSTCGSRSRVPCSDAEAGRANPNAELTAPMGTGRLGLRVPRSHYTTRAEVRRHRTSLPFYGFTTAFSTTDTRTMRVTVAPPVQPNSDATPGSHPGPDPPPPRASLRPHRRLRHDGAKTRRRAIAAEQSQRRVVTLLGRARGRHGEAHAGPSTRPTARNAQLDPHGQGRVISGTGAASSSKAR